MISEPEKFEIRARTYVEDHSLWSSTDSTQVNTLPSPLRLVNYTQVFKSE